MKFTTTLCNHTELESNLAQDENFQENKTKLFSIFNKVWQRFVAAIAAGNELQVWQGRDRSGEIEWNAYDPATGRTVFATSEAEMRSWIEQSYYQ